MTGVRGTGAKRHGPAAGQPPDTRRRREDVSGLAQGNVDPAKWGGVLCVGGVGVCVGVGVVRSPSRRCRQTIVQDHSLEARENDMVEGGKLFIIHQTINLWETRSYY